MIHHIREYEADERILSSLTSVHSNWGWVKRESEREREREIGRGGREREEFAVHMLLPKAVDVVSVE